MLLNSQFDNPDEPVNTVSLTMWIFVLCWNHHSIFLSLSIWYSLLSLLPPLRKGQYRRTCRHALVKLEDLIWWSAATVQYSEKRHAGLEGVIEVTFRILDPDVMRFRHYPFVATWIFYLTIKSQRLNRCTAEIWFMVVQQPLQKFIKYNFKEYVLIISEHRSIDFMFPVLFTMCTKLLSNSGTLEMLRSSWVLGSFDSSACSTDMSIPRIVYLVQYRVKELLFLTMMEVSKMGAVSISPIIGTRFLVENASRVNFITAWNVKISKRHLHRLKHIHQVLCLIITSMWLNCLVDWHGSFELQIYSCLEPSVVKLSWWPLCQIDIEIWLARWILGYPIWITRCLMVFQISWMPIACHQASNMIQWMENFILNWICSCPVLPWICVSS